ncbi:efflux RND transporter periplasmic adaptor subunit [Palleniella muris]|uniref:efflux RND transporter periplasmic adaptor subunit n=1 Tax=Palleniella muris TaxID=3038145 RepID=UPI0014410234|nr:efflux RND transporter periplasmic adaptor subunit [Palleniella muris]
MKKTFYIALAVLMGLCSCRRTADKTSMHTVMVTCPESSVASDGGEVSLPGTIKEGQTVQLSFKTSGQIIRLDVKEGDYVRKGQLVATLDAADYRIALDASQAQYSQMKSEVARIKTLYERNSVSKNEYEKAVAGLEQAAADLQAKKNQLRYTSLHSPASGYVQQVDSHIGEMVSAGSSVVTLIDVERMEVEVGLPYKIYQQRDNLTGFKAVVGGKEYPLTKLNVIPKAGSAQQYTMLLALPSDKSLKESSGINVEVRFSVSGDGDSLSEMTVPESAIVYEGSQPGVWVLRQDSTIVRKPIDTGTVIDGRVRVLKGLNGSETIVKAGVNQLHNGEKVRVLQQKSLTNPGGLL